MAQEFTLGRQVVLVCGEDMVDPTLAFLAIHIYDLAGSLGLVRAGPTEDINITRKTTKLKLDLADEHLTGFVALRKRTQAGNGSGFTLYELLRRFYVESGMDATVYKDRIFDLLGLAADEGQLGLRADYAISTSQMLTQVAKALIRTGQLEVLSLAQFPKRCYGLPSWVPDWPSHLAASFNPRIDQRLGQRSLFAASGNAQPIFIETQDDATVGFWGCVVDTIVDVGTVWYENPKTDGDDDLRRVNHLAKIEAFCARSEALGQDIYRTKNRRQESAWRVPIGDLWHYADREEIRVPETDNEEVDRVAGAYLLCIENSRWKAQIGDSEDGRFRARYDKTKNGNDYAVSMSFMGNRRPFLTRHGYLGIGPVEPLDPVEPGKKPDKKSDKNSESDRTNPHETAPGDQVVLFAGACIPHILRPKTEGCFEYIGEAYCDGVMDGEVWDKGEPDDVYLA